MKKIYLIILLFAIIPSFANARWYNFQDIEANGLGLVECPADSDTGGGLARNLANVIDFDPSQNGIQGKDSAADLNKDNGITSGTDYVKNTSNTIERNLNSKITYSVTSTGIGASEGLNDVGIVRCAMWDFGMPEATISFSTNDWTNRDVQINIEAGDTGGSGLSRVRILRKVNGTTSWAEVQKWENIGSNGLEKKHLYWIQTAPTNSAVIRYDFRIEVLDIAGNTINFDRLDSIKFDTENPSINNLEDFLSPINVTNKRTGILANEKIDLKILADVNTSDLGSPISYIEYHFEDFNNQNRFLGLERIFAKIDSATSKLTLNTSLNMTLVDNDSTPTDGIREYTLRIRKICDTAGNCISATGDIETPTTLQNATNSLRDYRLNNFANTRDIPINP